jgi:hypothetical protein
MPGFEEDIFPRLEDYGRDCEFITMLVERMREITHREDPTLISNVPTVIRTPFKQRHNPVMSAH